MEGDAQLEHQISKVLLQRSVENLILKGLAASELSSGRCRSHAQCPVAEEISSNKNLKRFKQSFDGERTLVWVL